MQLSDAIREREPPPAPAFEGLPPLPVPVVRAAEQDRPLPAPPARQDRAPRRLDLSQLVPLLTTPGTTCHVGGRVAP